MPPAFVSASVSEAAIRPGDPPVTPVIMSWSGGKDSCMALHDLQRSGDHEVVALLTTVTRGYDRVSMHGVRRELLHRQADSIGLPLEEVFIPAAAGNDEYEAAMGEVLSTYRSRGIGTVAFGDLFLADIRAYRDRLVARSGMVGIYPVWGRPTASFVREFIDRGFKAVTACVDLNVLDESFAGRVLNRDFLSDLPAAVDPCGENGEFHTFVFDGPILARSVGFSVGQRVTRGSFCFCDLEPEEGLECLT
ncbi:MAG: diphthine--ammonia ligase [Pseudomonadota bacterium]|nr:diphthine--ammonia ligase [Pseudomonadota bacterium]